MHGYSLWNSLFDFLGRGRSRFSLTWLAVRAGHALKKASTGRVWPLPLPYPELHRRGGRRGRQESARKLGCNFVVLVLNFLKFPERHWRNVTPPLGTALNKRQWDVVGRISAAIETWNDQDAITPALMGQAAAKVENVEEVLVDLAAAACSNFREGNKYVKGGKLGMQSSWGNQGSPGEVVGVLSKDPACLARAVKPERLKFWQTPSFDPLPFLDDDNGATFSRPLDFARPPDLENVGPPRVRVRMAQRDRVKFLELLDSCGRLALLPSEVARGGFENGLFVVPKDENRDRMVLDARPANCLEDPEKRWIRSLASVSQLLHFFVEPYEEIRTFAEDLREFYHAFLISPQRTLRNVLKFVVKPHEVAHLKCFDKKLWKAGTLVPALGTMAMGDLNAVSYGQTSHLGCLLQSGLFSLSDFVTLQGRPSRKRWLAGLMIDDLVLLQAVPRSVSEAEKETSECAEIISGVREVYKKVGLPRHEGKAVFNSLRGEFWGLELDGAKAVARPSLKRSITLAFILLNILQLGQASVALLEIIAGSLVSVFQVRRRLMAILEEVYGAQRGRERHEVVQLSRELKDEILCALALLPFAEIDFRLKPFSRVVCSDASTNAEAAVSAEIGSLATAELHKLALQKGAWSKLLSPVKAYWREKGWPEEESELPDSSYDMNPVWRELVISQRFVKLGKIRKVRRRRHINVGEVRAALEAERSVGAEAEDSFYIHLQDSQVSLACLVKGRSSSRSLNRELRRSIPEHLAANLRPFYGFVRSKLNPADDPTRDAAVREPSEKESSWLTDLKVGDFTAYDAFLEELGLDRTAVAGLPDEAELARQWDYNGRSKIEEKRKTREKKNDAVTGDAKPPKFEKLEKFGKEACATSITPLSRLEQGAEPAALPAEVTKLLRMFDSSQFEFSSCFGSLEEALASGPGFLDLFSGSRGVAKELVKQAQTWVLTFDLSHSPSENLLSPPLQGQMLRLIGCGAFRAMGAGPVCASFSTAVTPPGRNREYPEGVPWASELQQEKNRIGNLLLRFVLQAVEACCEAEMIFWVENPHPSWLWRQVGELSWEPLLRRFGIGDLVVDYCRFSTPWRKRTRFRTNGQLQSQKLMCQCKTPHVVLRGRSKAAGLNYTKLAEAYPRKLNWMLAAAMLADSGLLAGRRKLNISQCCRAQSLRIGEAKNPGPRGRQIFAREGRLGDIETLEPATILLRNRLWTAFLTWFEEQFPGHDLLEWMSNSPELFISALVGYGHESFASGKPLYGYRQLVAHCQKEFPALRGRLHSCLGCYPKMGNC